MEQVKYTAEQLADRFMDLRAIENTMGRYVNSLLLKQEDTILHDYWSRFENDICYGTNEGWYTGRRAVREYYEAMHRNTEIRSKLVQKLFPDFLGDKTDEGASEQGADRGRHCAPCDRAVRIRYHRQGRLALCQRYP